MAAVREPLHRSRGSAILSVPGTAKKEILDYCSFPRPCDFVPVEPEEPVGGLN